MSSSTTGFFALEDIGPLIQAEGIKPVSLGALLNNSESDQIYVKSHRSGSPDNQVELS
jgi:hypothetical protein